MVHSLLLPPRAPPPLVISYVIKRLQDKTARSVPGDSCMRTHYYYSSSSSDDNPVPQKAKRERAERRRRGEHMKGRGSKKSMESGTEGQSVSQSVTRDGKRAEGRKEEWIDANVRHLNAVQTNMLQTVIPRLVSGYCCSGLKAALVLCWVWKGPWPPRFKLGTLSSYCKTLARTRNGQRARQSFAAPIDDALSVPAPKGEQTRILNFQHNPRRRQVETTSGTPARKIINGKTD